MSEEEDTPEGSVPNSEQVNVVLENWAELKDVPLQELFKKGWKPTVKTRNNGKRYIMLRYQHVDEASRKRNDLTRSLGAFDPERWMMLEKMYLSSMYPDKPSNALTLTEPEKSYKSGSSVLSTKVARISPIGPTVHLELETLQWYRWLQKNASYPRTLDDFINQTVSAYFRDHHNLELAVVIQGES